MLSRSAGKPVFIALSTAAIVAAGAVHVQAAAEDAAAPKLVVEFGDYPKNPAAGKPVIIPASVKAVDGAATKVVVVSIRATAEGGVAAPLTGECVDGCALADIADAAASSPVKETTLTVSEEIKNPTTVTVTVLVDSETTEAAAATATLIYQPKVTPTPTPTPTKPPPTKTPKPSPTPTKTKAPDKGKDDEKNDDSGSGSSGNGSSGSGSTYTPPSPNGAFNTPNPQVALPPIAPPAPSVAPQTAASPESRLRNNKSPVAQDLTFERMASTQIAWLAALLVAFSLLTTHLRMGRRRPVPGTARALAATSRRKGEHRRPRRGLFGK